MQLKRLPLDALHLDPGNVRVHGSANMDAIIGSLKRFGQAEPLVVQAGSGRIIGGNGRWLAMKQLGWSDCDVVEVELESLDATALGIALNRSASLGEWDEPALASLLEQLRAEDSLDGVGFTGNEIDDLLAELGRDTATALEDPGPEAPPEAATSRTGDLWVLGEHRLLCGDCTRADDVARVMAGERAALCATDPPYLVDYTGDRPNDSGKDWTDTYREIDIQDADGFFRGVFTQVLAVLAPKAAIYCWHAHKRSGLIQRVWEDLGIVDHQQIIWVKPCATFGRVYWHFRHEPCVMGWRKGSQPEHDGRHDIDSVWEVDWDGKARVATDHPTSKPVELFRRPMRKHTRSRDICFEPFSGSGSQLIAGEELGRRVRAIEISPAYVDVAVLRWQAATGKAATLEATGEAFETVAAARQAEAPPAEPSP